jgi:hypothetical protein
MKIVLPLLLSAAGCVGVPCQPESCEGDVAVQCDQSCDDGIIITCEPIYSRTDCSQQVGISGNPMSCRIRRGADPFCIDTTIGTCDLPAVSDSTVAQPYCSEPNTATMCYLTEDGGYQGESNPVCTDPGKQCVPGGATGVCFDSPLVACTGPHARCEDADTVVYCEGAPGTSGTYERSFDCPGRCVDTPSPQCEAL